ncbi:unnamed protein product [Sphenostylis stenocarpa]|uniref:PGG domain-containing protein n=1 Tax=Sphenostylis stenocarpa TaxID=92480 RepID=A0AA86SZJ7_9FABA|nr:unnamed protein product [Sphenostylis stenocarpa]
MHCNGYRGAKITNPNPKVANLFQYKFWGLTFLEGEGKYFSGGGRKVILEVGCGAGHTIFPVIASYPDAFVYACDLSARAVELVSIMNMECVVQGIIETQHVEALEILLQGLCGVQRERLRIHEICLKSGPQLGTVTSEVRLLCDLEQAEPSWTVRHVGGAMRGAGAEQISVLVRSVVESKTSKNVLRMFYTLGYKLDHELLRVGFSFNFYRGAQITVTVSSINKMLKVHATDEAVPVTPGIQMVEVTAPAAAETYTEVAAAVSSFCEYLAPLLHLSKPGISTGVVPTAAAAAASLMSDELDPEEKWPYQTQHLLKDCFKGLLQLTEDRHRYLTLCVPLHKAALKGDWKEAKKILEQDPTLLKSAITKGWATVLHVAVGANHERFVEELVKEMSREDLELQDDKGNTAFCFAAAVGNVHIAEIMRKKNVSLPTIRGGLGVTPLHLAVLQGRSEMAGYLFDKSKESLYEDDWLTLFLICINSGLYELALDMLNEKESLAFARDENGETGLHILARKPSNCDSGSLLQYPKQLLRKCMKLKDPPALKLTKSLWNIFLTLEDSKMMTEIREPSQVTFLAAEVGNFDFLSVIMTTYPDLLWELNTMGRSIIHVAALHRHASIFNLIHEIGPIKEFLFTFVDDEGSTLLHCVAEIAPPDRLNIVSGAALQMMLELTWFEEVKRIMQPLFIEFKNNEGYIPKDLFTEKHEELLKRGESWMKRTASSCMVVSTLIATGVFSAAFSVPGGTKDDSGSPNYLKKPLFTVFALSDALALFTSSTSTLIFLSILISRYAEQDFLRSLPFKLISGLVTLFVSIISMMVAFSSAFFITYYHGSKVVPFSIAVLAFLPICLFIGLQFRLWHDIVYSHYICNSLFTPSKRMIQ